MCNNLRFRFCVLGVCGLLAILKVGCEKACCLLRKIELMLQLMQKLGVRDGVVCF